jgi:nucleotide-binding universal stress UspA family protein
MILCGTDLSIASEPARQVAAALAKRQGRELLLATVLENDDPGVRSTAELRIEQDAGELRRDFGIDVETCVLLGAPEERLLELAKTRSVDLLVVGAEGRAARARRLGSVPEHLCQTSPIPVLVARHADGFLEWSRGTRALAVLLGCGLGDASTAALSFTAPWPQAALTVAHVAWPYGEHYRLGVAGPIPLDHLRPEVHRRLLSDLERWTSQVPVSPAPKLQVLAGWGRVDSHLAQAASEHQADLLVVGSHHRNLAARFWHGSVSRGTLREAECNVLIVPQDFAHAQIAPSPRIVVVPTDFSALADRAIGLGYGLLQRGSSVHLVHVAVHLNDELRPKLIAELSRRMPIDAAARGIATELHALEGHDAWLSIWQYASRVGADLICMSTHSRDAIGGLLLGSQAQELLRHSRIPVVLVPPDRES